MGFKTITFLVLIALLFVGTTSLAQEVPEYSLEVFIDVPSSSLKGRAILTFKETRKSLSIAYKELKIHSMLLNERDITPTNPEGIILDVPKNSKITIDYEAVFKDSESNIISPKGIALKGTWYPFVDGRFLYKLTAHLPEGYIAISEAERINRDKRTGIERYDFHFPYPLFESDGISLIASKDFVVNKDKCDGIEIYTYLLPSEAHFAKPFIEHTKRYLKRYNKILGRYPYKRLSIVEHFDRAGYSLPTYIFLGREDFKLPIEKTPLGHEILHQWFGNYVFTDYDRGNWNEGFTIYFADHYYEEARGYGYKCRRRILSGYKSHVKEAIEFPLEDFVERYDYVSRSIGYGKSAMVVHMLRHIVGEKAFYEAVKDFVKANRFKVATWDDIQRAFERRTKMELGWFFEQWVKETGTPELTITDLKSKRTKRGYEITLTLHQGKTDFRMPVNITFYMDRGHIKKTLWLEGQQDTFYLTLPDKPKEVVIDEDYDLFRRLSPEEDPPTLERLLTDAEPLVILPKKRKGMYLELVELFEKRGFDTSLAYMKSGRAPRKGYTDKERRGMMRRSEQKRTLTKREMTEIQEEQLKDRSIVIFGDDNPLIERLGISNNDMAKKADSIIMQNYKHPFSPDRVVALITASLKIRSTDPFKEFFEYPFYSRYEHKDGKVLKSLTEPKRGLRFVINY